MGEAYHKIQIVLCAIANITLILELVERLKNILRFSEVAGIQGSKPL